MFQNVMFVCVGNICRSPMAEALLRKQRPQLNVFSSGVGAPVGRPADPISIELMTEQNIELSSHRSQQISSELISDSDLILAMEQKHIDVIHSKYPEARGKVHLIGKWMDDQAVPDPHRKDKAAFIAALNLIESGLEKWKNKLWKSK
ncbi:MAG: low molecular weight protein-tyrosine-phosphatase [Cocleimonas sp.]